MRVPPEREHGEASYRASRRRIVRDYSSDDPRLDAHVLRVPSQPMPKSMVKKILRDESQGSRAICVTEPRGPDFRCRNARSAIAVKSGCGSRSTPKTMELPAFHPPWGHARSRSIAIAGPVREDSRRHTRNAKMENAVGATQLTVSGTHGHPDSTDRNELACRTDGTSTAIANETQGPAVPIAIRIHDRPHV